MDEINNKINILLIGCTGFLGGRLVEMLFRENAYNITLTSNTFSGNGLARAAKYPIKITPANILDKNSLDATMENIDVVINGSYIKGGKDAIKSSVEGTKNLIEASIKHEIKHFIQISSAAVFEPDQTDIKTESDKFISKPDDYVKTKLLTEKAISKNLNPILNLKTKYTIIRPTRIYGPYSGYWTERILDGIKSNKKILIEEFKNNPSNFVYVDDVCNAIKTSILNDRAYGNDYNINGERELTWELLLNGLQDVVDPSGSIETASYKEIKSINSDKIKKLLPNAINSLKKALLSKESLDIFRSDLLLSSLYRSLYGNHRKSDQSISYNPQTEGRKTEDFSFLDKFFVKDMIAKTYISSEKIKNDLSLETTYFSDSIKDISNWNYFFSRESQVIDEFYRK